MKIPFWHYTPENCKHIIDYTEAQSYNDSMCKTVDEQRFVIWKEVNKFTTRLFVINYEYEHDTGMTMFILVDDHNHKYYCTIKNLLAIICHPEFSQGSLTATFEFTQHGQYYGIKLVK